MNIRRARGLSIGLWLLLAASVMSWALAGYSWVLCAVAILPLLAPLEGLIRGRRYTYAWASLFAIPYMIFAITEILSNARARWIGASTLMLVFAWFCSLVIYLRLSRQARPANR